MDFLNDSKKIGIARLINWVMMKDVNWYLVIITNRNSTAPGISGGIEKEHTKRDDVLTMMQSIIWKDTYTEYERVRLNRLRDLYHLDNDTYGKEVK